MLTFQRIISERRDDGSPPLIETKQDMMFFFRNSSVELGIFRTMSSIDAIITNHFKMFLWDMADETFDEF